MPERTDFAPTLSPRFAAYIRDFLMDRGVNPGPIFEQCAVPADANEESDRPLSVETVARLFERAAEVTGDSAIGLSMGRDFHYESSSLLIVAMLAAPSVGEGLKLLHKYDRFIDSGISTAFYPRRTPTEFTADLLHEGAEDMVQLNEYLMAFLVKTLRMATRQPVPLLEVSFQNNGSVNEASLMEFFKCPLKFSAEHNCIAFHPRFLEQRFLTSNNLLFRVLQNVMETYFSFSETHGGFLGLVCRQIMMETDISAVNAETVASRLNVSARTLRRRLSDEGVSFQEAKTLARERRAKYLLSNGNVSLTEIAYELGYSELSAFSRAFRSWCGETPQAYRENIRALVI